MPAATSRGSTSAYETRKGNGDEKQEYFGPASETVIDECEQGTGMAATRAR
jgi:hypothetical protein